MFGSSSERGKANEVVIVGGAGKTGRRVASRLVSLGRPVRYASRSTTPRFDWEDSSTWGAALQGASAAYVTYQPDLAVLGAVEAMRKFGETAKSAGLKRLVLLSGRGEPGSALAERVLINCGVPTTVLRSSWIAQNFSESFFVESVRAGVIATPAGYVREPFVDADDIADAAVAALSHKRHAGRIYELTGPKAISFQEVADELGKVTGRRIQYIPIAVDAYIGELMGAGVPAEVAALLGDLFVNVLDGRNTPVTGDVEEILGHAPRSFAAFAASVALGSRVWDSAAPQAAQASLGAVANT